ncbi:MGH1-like glycoside hydrolase domain-containing protein [Ferruginibacter albus]|uniref:MGH1-like glycoside hydrolase domain-containing protein n=1 Tax=Ferruginibacter albus TaxID=2875540 RepID=UPI001CC591D8|nr:glucosidase [Ferruginibacter albus]UAY52143.1 glucosidase [Ferruginibacter albus]
MTEQQRIDENSLKEVPLEKWGPYLSERQWGTVREDYSSNGDAWNYFPHDHARSRVYRWGEDGLAGISDYLQNLCFAVALWNGKDPILKERLFGLTNSEGNHGEDVKELYYYLDNTPTHYYMKYLYKYPQSAYPYNELIERNKKLPKTEPEYELLDTGILDEGNYFDVVVEYAKNSSTDIFIKIEIINRSTQQAAPITVMPTLWFHNRWCYEPQAIKPSIEAVANGVLKASHPVTGEYFFYFDSSVTTWFTENETNTERLFEKPNASIFVKDAFHEALINNKNIDLVKNKKEGTKAAPVFQLNVKPGESQTIFLRLADKSIDKPFDENTSKLFDQRKQEADEFYRSILSKQSSLSAIQRQALSGLLWSKQYYHYDVAEWLEGTDNITAPSDERKNGRNHDWKYLKNKDIIIMPDKWEYPWYAAWDTAFHCIAFALIDSVFAKHQLILLTREWFMNPEGQMPAYEWNFGDVNPPIHAFAALEIYTIEKQKNGKGDIQFLKKIFQKLIINFTWWVNRKDANGNNVFEGGFLGLDNIGVFNRSVQLPNEVLLEQADGTSWMAMYALNLMDIALEIAQTDDAFEDTATKFYEHFIYIAEALNKMGLWNEEDCFFYDVLLTSGQPPFSLKVRSLVGLVPLYAASVIPSNVLEILKDFKKRTDWFNEYRSKHNLFLPNKETENNNDMLLSVVNKEKLSKILERLLDESEFLSKGGIRALSKFYEQNPYSVNLGGQEFSVAYDPGDSTSGMFGGNSNWRGPVWMPANYLLIKAIKKYGEYYGDSFKTEYPKGSGNFLNLQQVALELAKRVIGIFSKDESGDRQVFGKYNQFYKRPENKDLLLFHEYFHGDTSRGIGASHQTGWTALVANLIAEFETA